MPSIIQLPFSIEQAIAEQNARDEQWQREIADAKSVGKDRVDCLDFYNFVARAWHVLEPNNPFKGNWHIVAKCKHLQAISEGRMPPRLQINEPGGFAKSIVASVFWQAWEWGPFGRPDMRYFTTAYQGDYAKRDARRTRDLMLSDWYRARWPSVKLTRVGEMSFANTQMGYREAVPFSRLTSGRGNRLIIDDPHSTEQAESEAERETATRMFRESAQDRLNEPETDAIVVIMHRLHREDICGIIQSLGLQYTKLILQMEFEKDRRCVTYLPNGQQFWQDPRTAEGELLFPERLGRTAVDELKRAMGSIAVACKFQQNPTPREGALFKRSWLEGKIIPADRIPRVLPTVRHHDLAATAKGGARTAGVKISEDRGNGRFIVRDCKVTQEDGAGVRRFIRGIAQTDGRGVHISLPQDPGQAGKAQAQDFIRDLVGWVVKATPETGSKESRAEPFAAQMEAGNVWLEEGDWNEAFIDELCEFPNGKYKDRVDAASGAFSYLVTENISTYTLANIRSRQKEPV